MRQLISMENHKTLFCSSWSRERISSKFIDNLGTRSQKSYASPVLEYSYKKINFTDYSATTCFHESTQTAVTRINIL